MSSESIPPSVVLLFWDVDPATLDLDRDRAYVLERVMSRGTWDAMQWLRSRYSREEMAEYIRTRGVRQLSPRDLAYWSLIAEVEVEPAVGGGRPSWAG